MIIKLAEAKWRVFAKKILKNGIKTNDDKRFVSSLVDGVHKYAPDKITILQPQSNNPFLAFHNMGNKLKVHEHVVNPNAFEKFNKKSTLKDLMVTVRKFG